MVKLRPFETHSKGGILLPEAHSRKRPPIGVVTHIGPDVNSVRKHDEVIYAAYSATQVDDDIVIVDEADIMAIIT